MSGITQVSSDDAGWRFAQCFGDKVSPPQSRSRSRSGQAEQATSSHYRTRRADHALSHSPQGEVEDITEADIICKSPSEHPTSGPPGETMQRGREGQREKKTAGIYKWHPLGIGALDG